MNNKDGANTEKLLNSIITKDIKGHIQVAFAIFLCFLVVCSTIVISSLGEYSSFQKSYYESLKDNVLEVTKKYSGSTPEILNYEDLDKIKDLVGDNANVWGEYVINFGVPDTDNNRYFVYNFSKELYDEIGLDYSEANICYSNNSELDGKDIHLRVPLVEATEDGWISSEAVDMVVHCKYVPETKFTFVNDALSSDFFSSDIFSSDISSSNDSLLVGENTYYDIAKFMFGIDYRELERTSSDGARLGAFPINRIYVHSNKAEVLDEADNILMANHYNIKLRTLNYFDNFEFDMGELIQNGIFLTVVLLIVVTIFVFSYAIYFKSLQNDFGALKEDGYSDKNIFRIYMRNILRAFLLAIVIMCTYNFILGSFFIKYMFFEHFMILCGVEAILLVLVFAIISLLLWTKCKKSYVMA